MPSACQKQGWSSPSASPAQNGGEITMKSRETWGVKMSYR
jgi:hypothetical protein